MKNITYFGAIILLGFAVASCTVIPAPAPTTTTTISGTQALANYIGSLPTVNAGSNTLNVNQEFYVEQHDGDSPQGLWTYTSDSKIQFVDSRSFNTAAPGVVGAGAEVVWKFKCISSGSSALTFTQGTNTAVVTYNITIN